MSRLIRFDKMGLMVTLILPPNTHVNTVKPVLEGHLMEGQNWLLKSGDPLIQTYLHYILIKGTKKM